jgi:hypothetical protein
MLKVQVENPEHNTDEAKTEHIRSSFSLQAKILGYTPIDYDKCRGYRLTDKAKFPTGIDTVDQAGKLRI